MKLKDSVQKGHRFFTQKWTWSETLQISHAVLFKFVKQCSACYFPVVLFPFWDITYAKKYIFPRASSGDLLNQKHWKPFVSLGEVTEVWHLPLMNGLVQDCLWAKWIDCFHFTLALDLRFCEFFLSLNLVFYWF